MIPEKVLGKKYTINGFPADLEGFSPDMSAGPYYEVVRLTDGKFLFLQDHLARLRHSLSDSGLEYPGDDRIRENLKLLQSVNEFSSGNIRICIQEEPEGKMDLLCFFIPHAYPGPELYKEGVLLEVYPHVRPDPGIKKWDETFRTSVGRFIREKGIYEAILLNGLQEVTEGSRSNLFFLEGNNTLVTAPVHTVLPGITRKYILEICVREDIKIKEIPVRLQDLDRMQAGFISGTSPKVLPVRQLDNYRFRVDHPVLRMLMKEYDKLMEKHLVSLINP
jgi:branched-chain amino acid aminotransferase